MEAWQHVELTVTNCPFGLTIKYYCAHNKALLSERTRQYSGQRTRDTLLRFFVDRFLGDHSERDPPVPIPNTAVKPLSPDGTARASVWERRKLPGLSHGPTERSGLCVSGIKIMRPGMSKIIVERPR